mgnify:CR=1 FL=1
MIIDGHNLIPHLSGINLADPEDEMQLIDLLQEFCRLRRKSVEVYFDRAPVGYAGERSYGRVRAVFVPNGVTADDAIMARLKQLGKRARNVQVVSSDRQVQQAARAAHADVMSSEAFAALWERLLEEEPALDIRNRPLTDSEVEVWERLFDLGDPSEDQE